MRGVPGSGSQTGASSSVRVLTLLLLLSVQVAGPVLDGLRGMSSLLLESEDAGYLLQVCEGHKGPPVQWHPECKHVHKPD
jgi:hypothetical protein